MQLTIILLIWMLPILCQSVCFKVYWNAPTKNCQKFGVNFENIPTTYGIIQNAGDEISGNQVAVLNRPGLYPYMKESELLVRTDVNGAVPQRTNWVEHWIAFDKKMEESVDREFAGLGIIDLHSDDSPEWRPIYYQNTGPSLPYRLISFELTGENVDEAIREFEAAARKFLDETLTRAKKLRPDAMWAYQDYPTCIHADFRTNTSCRIDDMEQNDKLSWLWQSQDYLMPRMHTYIENEVEPALMRVGTRMHEVQRIRNRGVNKKIFFYLEIQREDGKAFLNKDVVEAVLKYMMDHGCDGVFLYEYSRNLRTQKQCQDLLDHLQTTLGPTVKKVLQEVDCLVIPEITTPSPKPSSTSAPELLTLPPVILSNTSTVPPTDFSEELSDENSVHTRKPNKPNFQPTCEPITVIFNVFCFFIIQILA